jgi:hypothetical protein
MGPSIKKEKISAIGLVSSEVSYLGGEDSVMHLIARVFSTK